jgi:polyhydroxybutyrate depolymerase
MTGRRRIFLLLFVILLLIAAAAWRRGGARSERVQASTPTGTLQASIEVGGLIRNYLIHVPTGYAGGTPLPLIFVLHGATQSPRSAEEMSAMSTKADQQHFLAVYPSGTGRLNDVPTWNAGNCCGYAIENHIDDIAFFRALIEKLEHDYAVDPKRIDFTGISNGAMMSYRVACEMSDQVAAIAPVEGALNVDCHPSAPVSVLIFHGTADRLVPYNGGGTPFQIGEKRTDNSVAGAVDFWVKRDSCGATPAHEAAAESQIDRYSNCQNGTGVSLYTIPGGRHMWPGLSISGNSIPATDLILSFFAAHPKP